MNNCQGLEPRTSDLSACHALHYLGPFETRTKRMSLNGSGQPPPGMDQCLPRRPQPTEGAVVVLTRLQRRWPASVNQEVVPEGETQTGRLCFVSQGMRDRERKPLQMPHPCFSLPPSESLSFWAPRRPGPPPGFLHLPPFLPRGTPAPPQTQAD